MHLVERILGFCASLITIANLLFTIPKLSIVDSSFATIQISNMGLPLRIVICVISLCLLYYTIGFLFFIVCLNTGSPLTYLLGIILFLASGWISFYNILLLFFGGNVSGWKYLTLFLLGYPAGLGGVFFSGEYLQRIPDEDRHGGDIMFVIYGHMFSYAAIFLAIIFS